MPRVHRSIVTIWVTVAAVASPATTGCRSGSDDDDGNKAASEPTDGNGGVSTAGTAPLAGGNGGVEPSAGNGGLAPLGGAGGSATAHGGGGGSTAARSGAGASGLTSAGASGSNGESGGSPCEDATLVWKTANKTNFTSYPDPGSEECVKYNGCMWAGLFAACDDKKSETWVSEHDIVAAFPDFETLELHDLCLRHGNSTLVVTVLDTCADSDCSGCCTQNKGSADELIDMESSTDARWGVDDGPIEWADLGPTRGSGCN
jgi:hypothetical protein